MTPTTFELIKSEQTFLGLSEFLDTRREIKREEDEFKWKTGNPNVCLRRNLKCKKLQALGRYNYCQQYK